jgi:hypothetical protein
VGPDVYRRGAALAASSSVGQGDFLTRWGYLAADPIDVCNGSVDAYASADVLQLNTFDEIRSSKKKVRNASIGHAGSRIRDQQR